MHASQGLSTNVDTAREEDNLIFEEVLQLEYQFPVTLIILL